MRSAQKNSEEASLQQDGFPSEGVKGLSDVDERQIENVNRKPNANGQPGVARADAGDHDQGKHDPGPRSRRESRVSWRPEEEAGRLPKWHLFDEQWHWQEPAPS